MVTTFTPTLITEAAPTMLTRLLILLWAFPAKVIELEGPEMEDVLLPVGEVIGVPVLTTTWGGVLVSVRASMDISILK
jgi:hypothetical protein